MALYGKNTVATKELAKRSWVQDHTGWIKATRSQRLVRSLYRDHRVYLGARFGLSKAMGSQRLERSLYRDLRAYLGARFRPIANTARSGDLILGHVGVTVGS